MIVVEAFFDCSSPWTFMGFHNLRKMEPSLGARVRWRPFLVGGVFNTVNDSVYQFRKSPIPAKDAYMVKDMQDWAGVAGLKIRWRPTIFPINSVKAMRGCLVAERDGKLEAFAEAVFHAYWSCDRDISDSGVLAELAQDVGLEAQALLAGIVEPEIKDALWRNTDELIRRGGYGTPTFFVDGSDMYFGQDRLGLVERAVRALQRAGEC